MTFGVKVVLQAFLEFWKECGSENEVLQLQDEGSASVVFLLGELSVLWRSLV